MVMCYKIIRLKVVEFEIEASLLSDTCCSLAQTCLLCFDIVADLTLVLVLSVAFSDS